VCDRGGGGDVHPVAGEAEGVCAERVGEGEDMRILRPGNRYLQDVVSVSVMEMVY